MEYNNNKYHSNIENFYLLPTAFEIYKNAFPIIIYICIRFYFMSRLQVMILQHSYFKTKHCSLDILAQFYSQLTPFALCVTVSCVEVNNNEEDHVYETQFEEFTFISMRWCEK